MANNKEDIMKTMTENQMQDMLDERFGVESFLVFEEGGKIMHSGNIGVWKDEGDHYKVVLFNDEEEYKVTKDTPVPTKKEIKMSDHTDCEALTTKGEPCKNNATHERDGKKVCGPHLKAKNVKWRVEVSGALEDGAINTPEPEKFKEGVAKAKAALPNNKEEAMEDSLFDTKQYEKPWIYTPMLAVIKFIMDVMDASTIRKEGLENFWLYIDIAGDGTDPMLDPDALVLGYELDDGSVIEDAYIIPKVDLPKVDPPTSNNKEEDMYENIKVFLVSDIQYSGKPGTYRTYVYTKTVEQQNLTLETIKVRAKNTLKKEGVVAVVITGVKEKPWVMTENKSVLVDPKFAKYRKAGETIVKDEDTDAVITLKCQHFVTDAEGKKRKCLVEFTTNRAERLTGCPEHHNKGGK